MRCGLTPTAAPCVLRRTAQGYARTGNAGGYRRPQHQHLQVEPSELDTVKVAYTIFDGRVVYPVDRRTDDLPLMCAPEPEGSGLLQHQLHSYLPPSSGRSTAIRAADRCMIGACALVFQSGRSIGCALLVALIGNDGQAGRVDDAERARRAQVADVADVREDLHLTLAARPSAPGGWPRCRCRRCTAGGRRR